MRVDSAMSCLHDYSILSLTSPMEIEGVRQMPIQYNFCFWIMLEHSHPVDNYEY